MALSPRLDYGNIMGLSSEVKERLGKLRPTSIVSIFLAVLFLINHLGPVFMLLLCLADFGAI